jgi:HD-GYP domain-containing protein (c-di-GMP phosphodiesterase class II)/DNA-binding CsgD family transcriptional regulator
MRAVPDDAPLPIGELLVPLSLVTDLGMGVPDGQSARAAVLATALAERMGLQGAELSDVYYTTLLKHLGCTATAHEEASRLGGDELATRPLFSRTDESRPREMLGLLASIGAGRGPLARGRILFGAVTGIRWGVEVQRAVCEVATLIAERLRMPGAVVQALGQGFERWDGKGAPQGLKGDEISVSARYAHVASRAAAFHDLGGDEAAIESVQQSRDGWFDPAIADAFVEHGRSLLAELDAADPLDAAIEQEPAPRRTVDKDGVERVALAFAEMADLKSTYTLGHSTGVADLAAAAASRLELDEERTRDLQLAALLHDIGRVAVPSGIWEKPGRLGSAQWERIRLHPYYTERILGRAEPLASIAELAGRHHERLDGSGYHRGSGARDLPLPARVLAAADCFQTKTQARPHRSALTPEEAAELLAAEAEAGRLDADAVTAVIEAAGETAPRTVREFPARLTEREVDVLRLLAEGCSNREIASRLVISPRTAEHHVQHIYEKIGLSTRAGATMFALQHELIPPAGEA